jgi:hypothetical protein
MVCPRKWWEDNSAHSSVMYAGVLRGAGAAPAAACSGAQGCEAAQCPHRARSARRTCDTESFQLSSGRQSAGERPAREHWRDRAAAEQLCRALAQIPCCAHGETPAPNAHSTRPVCPCAEVLYVKPELPKATLPGAGLHKSKTHQEACCSVKKRM